MAVPLTSSAVPILSEQAAHEQAEDEQSHVQKKRKMAEEARLRIHLDDLDHPAMGAFASALDLSTVLRKAIDHVHHYLYIPFGRPQTVRSVTLILRDTDGVAYTSGTPLDEQHKEIVFSLNHLQNFMQDRVRLQNEAMGVITHEMVHCFQHDMKGTAPWWLIEGVSDFVRLKADLSPPHWHKGHDENSRGKSWDEGYQKTAWFLEFLELKFGPGTISAMNAFMRDSKYEEKVFWPKLFSGHSVQELWARYKRTWERKNKNDDEEAEVVGNETASQGPISHAGSEAEIVDLDEDERAEASRQ